MLLLERASLCIFYLYYFLHRFITIGILFCIRNKKKHTRKQNKHWQSSIFLSSCDLFFCSTQQMSCFRWNSKGRDQHNFVISASFITIFLKASADKMTVRDVVLSHVDPKNSDHGPMETRFLNSSYAHRRTFPPPGHDLQFLKGSEAHLADDAIIWLKFMILDAGIFIDLFTFPNKYLEYRSI